MAALHASRITTRPRAALLVAVPVGLKCYEAATIVIRSAHVASGRYFLKIIPAPCTAEGRREDRFNKGWQRSVLRRGNSYPTDFAKKGSGSGRGT